MTIGIGTRLGAYEVAGSLGAGGMGEVYRARDMKLGRDVAIKILPEAFAGDVQGFAPDARPAAAVGKWTISTAGGDKPRWSRDGRELFYVAPDGKMMAVPVKTGATFEPGLPVPLFDVGVLTGFFPYVVTRDGRFLMHTLADGIGAAAPPMTVVLNWRSALDGD